MRTGERMNGPRSVFILLAALVLGLSMALPQQDLPETAYDESESLPYEGTPLFTVSLPDCLSQPIDQSRSCAPRRTAVRLQGTNLRAKDRFALASSRTILDHSLRC